MWHLLFIVAAAAGSGIIAKRLFSTKNDPPSKDQLHQEEKNVLEHETQEEEEQESGDDPVKPLAGHNPDSKPLVVEEEGIFRFSSLDRGDGSGFRSSSKGLLKKRGGLKGNVVDCSKRIAKIVKIGEQSVNDDQLVVEDQRKKGRRFTVSLKRRRTNKNAFRKCTSCSSKGKSSFSQGLGVGLMYMISAGKTEINKLNVAVEETTKAVNNLKLELHKRKLSRELQGSSCKDGVDGCPEETGKNKHLLPYTSHVEIGNRGDTKDVDLPSTDDGEDGSIVTEEPEMESLEMDKLEAELEAELQKIPHKTDTDYIMEFASTELSESIPQAQGSQEPHPTDPNSSEFYAVSPTELDRKLCHLLIKQQEHQILELESKLQVSQSKLCEKEAELQALKDVVRCLRDFSLGTASDDETEDAEVLNEEQERNSRTDPFINYSRSVDDGSNKQVVTEQKASCGVKRAMECESWDSSWLALAGSL